MVWMHVDDVVLVLAGNTHIYSLGRLWLLTIDNLVDVLSFPDFQVNTRDPEEFGNIATRNSRKFRLD